MRKIMKRGLCLLFALLVIFATSVPAFAEELEYMKEHGEEGQRLWEAYQEALKPLRDGEYPRAYERLDELSAEPYNRYNEMYEKMTGRPQEEYFALSPYEQFLWASTILEPYWRADIGYTFNSTSEWYDAMSTFDGVFWLNCDDNKDMANAYHELMYWLYDYYDHSGALYNFNDGKDTLDYINEKYVNEDNKDSEDSSSEEPDDVDTASLTEPMSTASENVSVHISNIESSKVTANNGSKVPVVIIVVLVAVIGVMAVALFRKKR